MYELRSTQKEAVGIAYEHLKKGKDGGILYASCGWGKSIVIADLALKLNEPVMVLQPSVELLIQNYEKMMSYNPDIDVRLYSASAKKKELGQVTYGTIGSIKDYDLFKHFKYILIDECFTGDTEILTEKGFVRFDKLEKNEKIGQWDNYKISFVEPLRWIDKEYEGEMINFQIRDNVVVPMTPNHQQVYINKKGEILKKEIKKISQWEKIPVAGEVYSEEDSELTFLERLLIATQADGSIHSTSDKHVIVAFSLKKERKIERLLKLLNDSKLEYVKGTRQTDKERWFVRFPIGTTKCIYNHIDYKMSSTKAKAIIEEMVNWDGSRVNENLYYFSSVDENVTNFYQFVSTLAGYKTKKTIQKDNRKESHRDVYRLFIHLTEKTQGTQSCKKETYNYKGRVYCVEVPSGKIMVRHNGYVFVTGNCHMVSPQTMESMYGKFFRAIGNPPKLGLTGTPFRLVNKFVKEKAIVDGREVLENFYTSTVVPLNRIPNAKATKQGVNTFLYKSIIYRIEMDTLMKDDWLVRPQYDLSYSKAFDYTNLKMNTTGANFDEEALEAFVNAPDRLKQAFQSCKDLEDKGKKSNLVFCSSVKQAEKLAEMLRKSGSKAESLKYNAKDRADILRRFKEGETTHLINYKILGTGYDRPDLEAITVARPIISPEAWIQIGGRVIRKDPHNPNKTATINDVAGVSKRLGRIETIRMQKEEGGFRDEIVSEVGVLSNKPLFKFRIESEKLKNLVR